MVILQILQGNVDTLTVHKNMFDWRINARYIRINPRAWTPTGQICMRMEIYLCHNYQGEWLHKKLSITLTSATEQMWTTWQKKNRQGSSGVVPKMLLPSPEKTADISRRHHWFPREMTSEKRAQKFHTDDATLLSSIKCFWLVEENFPPCMTNQKHYPNQGRVASSVWNFRARFCQTSIPGETSAGVAECRLFPQTTATPTNGHQNATRRELTNVKTEGAFLPSEDLKVLPGSKISCLYIATNRLQKHWTPLRWQKGLLVQRTALEHYSTDKRLAWRKMGATSFKTRVRCITVHLSTPN